MWEGSSKVAIVRVQRRETNEIEEAIRKLVNLTGGLDIDRRDKVVVKINVNSLRTEDTGSVTDKKVLEALLIYLMSNHRDLNISVVEGSATGTNAELYTKWLGYLEIIGKYRARFIDLTKDHVIKKTINGLRFKEINVPRTINEANFFISLAKLKTHLLTKITCTLKNQFGALPYKWKIRFHNKLDEAIVDANIAMKPDYSIVDGIIAMQTERGPTYGEPVRLNLLIGGKDPVSVDATCARIMGFNPYFIGHIRKASSKRIGNMNPIVVGEKLKDVKSKFKFSYLVSTAYRAAYFFRKQQEY